MKSNRVFTWVLLSVMVVTLPAIHTGAFGQDQENDRYILPPPQVQDILSRDKNYATLNDMSPDGDHFLVPLTTELSSHRLMSQPILRLAMLKVTPDTNRELDHSTYGIYGLQIFSLRDRTLRRVNLPENSFFSDMVWSPDGSKVAFLAHLPKISQVWVFDVETLAAKPWSESPVMATLASAPRFGPRAGRVSRMIQWTPDGSILTLLVPVNRGPVPDNDPIPSSPIIRRSLDKATPTTTLPFLLRDGHDRSQFRYYTTAQIALLAPAQAPRLIGNPGMFLGFSLSPDGKYLLTDRIVDPLSFLVGYSNFGHVDEVVDLDGKILSTVRKTPLQEAINRDGAGDAGPDVDLPRDIAWRPDGKGLSFQWMEPRKKGEAGEAETSRRKDRIMLLAPPFDLARADIVASSEHRIGEVLYSPEGGYCFATLTDRSGGQGKRKEHIVAWDLRSPAREMFYLARDTDPDDLVKLPGELWSRSTGNGVASALIAADGSTAWLKGEGYQTDFKPRPFVDRVAIRTGEKQRVFEGGAEFYESPLVPLDGDVNRMTISRESKTLFPDSYLWSRQGSPDRLTRNRDPYPEITACRRIDFEFVRPDGLTVHGRISLPTDYDPGTRVPAIFWDYPREYSANEEYGRDAIRSRNQNEFTHLSFLRWSDIWLTQGYALVYTDIPIIGKGNAFNDKYRTHLLDSVYGAIRKLDQMGYIDVDRLGHGGHSYGAFATANLLAHAPFFKAGIAGDGAYNRSLTPMTFQRERRFLWDAQTTYLEMSPFFYADQINAPILMYHGGEDDNSGTFLIQSERMMQALTGLGKTAVLYVYPFEAHSPRCKETYLDFWARWLQWFDRYVKNPEGAKEHATSGPR